MNNEDSFAFNKKLCRLGNEPEKLTFLMMEDDNLLATNEFKRAQKEITAIFFLKKQLQTMLSNTDFINLCLIPSRDYFSRLIFNSL